MLKQVQHDFLKRKDMYEEELKEIKTYQGRIENLRGYL
jgi:hypothetical protein